MMSKLRPLPNDLVGPSFFYRTTPTVTPHNREFSEPELVDRSRRRTVLCTPTVYRAAHEQQHHEQRSSRPSARTLVRALASAIGANTDEALRHGYGDLLLVVTDFVTGRRCPRPKGPGGGSVSMQVM